MAEVLLVSTCTNQKRFIPESNCRLENCLKGNAYLTAKTWFKNLQSSGQNKCSAEEMYLGSHWKETLACRSSLSDKSFKSTLWVLSAGWGTLPSTAVIPPYAATFSSGHDSIQSIPAPPSASPKDKSRKWWKLLHQYRKQPNWPSLINLPHTAKTRKPILLVVVSREYFNAIEPELIELHSKGIPIHIISAGLGANNGGVSPLISDAVLPLNDKFKQLDDYLNKTNTSLNARLATWIVREHGDLLGHPTKLYSRLAAIEADLPTPKRKPVNRMTDTEVLQFIANHHSQRYDSATKLLRKLRDDHAQSCEQKRFGRLFHKYLATTPNRGLFNG